MWRAEHEISGSQTGLQGTDGLHKEALGVPAAGDLELAGLQAPIILPMSIREVSILSAPHFEFQIIPLENNNKERIPWLKKV